MKIIRILLVASLIFVSSCAMLQTKTGGTYEQRHRGEGKEKMWGCAYSGTKLDYVILKSAVPEISLPIKLIVFAVVSIDLIFSSVLDTIFYPADYLHNKYQDKNFNKLCNTTNL